MTTTGENAGFGTPAAEFPLDVALVAALLHEQHPDLAGLPLSAVGSGWDNALFRLGERLAVRLPRRALAAPLTLHEQTWLPVLAKQLTFPVPAPLRIGRPGCGYPWHWSVVPWFPGRTAAHEPPGEDQAVPLARFLRSLHRPAPPDAPSSRVRGVPLARRAAGVEERLQRLAKRTAWVTPQLRRLWAAALDAPPAGPSVWLHGDLHPRNVLVQDGRIAGIIDWGDVTSGDPATDLACIWMMFAKRPAREAAWAAYGERQAAVRLRAQGWALLLGAMFLDTGLVDQPENVALGERILRNVVDDAG